MKAKLRGLNAERIAENRATFLLMNTPDGKLFMDRLDKQSSKILCKTPDGVVDPYAMAYAAGQHDLIKQIKDMIEDGKLAR